jgi:CRP-like cAMP-binding protein
MHNNNGLKTNNNILNALPTEDLERLLPHFESVELKIGQIIYHPKKPITHVYFMNNAIISIIAATAEGQSAEVGVVGYEGAVGIESLMGAESAMHQHIVQHADSALRININKIKPEFLECGVLHDQLLHFTRLLMIQISQTALCNRLHTVEERLSRWLLMCRDRSNSDKLQLTQEFLAIMLGANRATVTLAAIALQSAGFIKYSRGQITIINRQGLQDYTCECYSIVKSEYERIE